MIAFFHFDFFLSLLSLNLQEIRGSSSLGHDPFAVKVKSLSFFRRHLFKGHFSPIDTTYSLSYTMPFTTISELNGYFAKKFADDFAKLPPMSSEVFASPYGEDGLRFGENIHVIMCGDGRLLYDRHTLWKIEPFSWLVREVFRAIAGKMDAVVRYCFLSEGKCGHLDYMPLFLSQFIMALKDIANAVRAEEAAVNGSLKGGLTMAGQTQDQQVRILTDFSVPY